MSESSEREGLKRLWRRLSVALGRRGGVVMEPDLWRGREEFLALDREIRERTPVTRDRCFMIYQLARHAAGLEGDFAEVGVFRGGTARLTARACPSKTLHLFDTFAGMPGVDRSVDHHREGDFADTSLEGVKAFLAGCENLAFHPGFFPDTAKGLEERRFAYLHCDVDIYESVLACLEFFYPRMTPGGVMLFDDYEWKDCPGVRKALDEFLAGKPERVIKTTLNQGLILRH